MDQGFQEGQRQGDGHCELPNSSVTSDIAEPSGLHVRVREAPERARAIRPRVGGHDAQGDGAGAGDQDEARKGLLEEQVSAVFVSGSAAPEMWGSPSETYRMSGNKARARQENAQNIERHIELVQPRTTNATADPEAALAEKEKIREKIKVRAAGRKAMAEQQLKAKGSGKKKESRLIPADGASMGMGMQVD